MLHVVGELCVWMSACQEDVETVGGPRPYRGVML
jgi:hypothetical protein